MRPDINAIEERRKRLYKSDADNVYVEDYLADTEFLLNRINDLTTQLAEAKADYEAAVEDILHDCEYCQYAEVHWDKGECATCDKSEFDGEIRANNWTYRGRQGNG